MLRVMAYIKYQQLQVNPHSSARTDKIDSAPNIQCIEAKKKNLFELSTQMIQCTYKWSSIGGVF